MMDLDFRAFGTLLYSFHSIWFEGLFFGVTIVVFLCIKQSARPSRSSKLSQREIELMCSEWQPLPLDPPLTATEKKLSRSPVLESAPERYTTIKGKRCLNVATSNFLGFSSNTKCKSVAIKTLARYGCGSCGPRGFYGTVDVHLNLEKRLAEFLGTDNAILYASAYTSISSIIPAFMKVHSTLWRQDLILCDAAVHRAIVEGINLSRGTVRYFQHNNMAHLQQLLEDVRLQDLRTKQPLNRRFLITEGVFQYSGDIAPLPEFLALSKQYYFRTMVDESQAIGVLGATGRGTCEHFGIKPSEIDIVTGSLGTALGSYGGFCCANEVVVEHQRLSAAGYVFSASLPPYLCTSAIEAIDQLDANPQMCEMLRKKATLFREAVSAAAALAPESCRLSLRGPSIIPMVHIELVKPIDAIEDYELALQRMADVLLDERDILISRARFVESEHEIPLPSLCVNISVAHSNKELKQLAQTIQDVALEVIVRYRDTDVD